MVLSGIPSTSAISACRRLRTRHLAPFWDRELVEINTVAFERKINRYNGLNWLNRFNRLNRFNGFNGFVFSYVFLLFCVVGYIQ